MSDLDKLEELFNKFNLAFEKRDLEKYPPSTWMKKEFPDGTVSIDIRLNGFVFDKDGNFIDIWAEYD